MSAMIRMWSKRVVIVRVMESIRPFHPDYTVQWPVARKAGQGENKTICTYSLHFSLWPFLACLAQAVATRFEQRYLITPSVTQR
jgi:hypothetical protein